MTLRTALCVAAGALLCVLLLAAPAFGSHYVSYEYYAYATGSDGIPLMDEQVLMGATHCDGAYTKTGAAGNYGTCAYEADHAAARVWMTAGSHGVQVSTYDVRTGTGRVETVNVMDELLFWIPAGEYPDGVTATLHGHARGSLWSAIGGSAQAGCWAAFGNEVYQTGVMTVPVDESSSIVVDDAFALVQEIVLPGTIYATPQVVSRQVRLLIHRGWTSSNAYNPGGGYVTGDAGIDFSEGVWADALVTEPAVWWGSESGVFMGRVADVPDGPPGLALTNAPNPFNPSTRISVTLPGGDAPVHLAVYDVMGRVVRTLADGEVLGSGLQQFTWDGRDDAGRSVPSGTYLARITAGELRAVRPMLLVK